MIIAYDTPGQLGNQLWAYTNVIAIAKELNASVCIILQDDYYKLLDEDILLNAKKDKVFIYNAVCKKAKIIKRVVSFFTAPNKKQFKKTLSWFLPVSIIHELNEKSFNLLRGRNGFLLVNAWELREYQQAFLKQSDFIRQLIKPEQISKRKADDKIAQLKSKFDLVVAVHIRRGDYKDFFGGKYYFEDDVYKEKMKQFSLMVSPSSICFSIFSNEKIALENFAGLDVSFDNNNTAIGDMWAISQCSYIMGPLSTFSMWASFWNNVPLQFITKEDAIASVNTFSPFIAQDLQKKNLSLIKHIYGEL